MNETLENNDTTTTPVIDRQPHRLYRALALVGIAAGSLFAVATVFFSGYIIGSQSGGGGSHSGGGGGHHGRHAMLIPHPPMGPGGPEGPERFNPPAPPSQQPNTPPRP